MDERGTWARPRGQAWGNDAQRAVLHAVAEDVVRRTGFKVAAIEALRSDGNLEFVAIAGNSAAAAELLGKAAPLALERIVSFGTHMDGWVLIPEERLDEATRAWIAEYGHTPDIPASDHADAWRAEDRLVRLLRNEDGALRATLYLDEPVSGLRPTAATIEAINAEVALMFQAIVSIVEREHYGEQVRMVSQARAARHSVGPGLPVGDFLRDLSAAMVERMPVDSVDVLLAGQPAPSLEPHTAFFEEHMHRVWLRNGHLVVEPTQTWGVRETAVATPDVLAGALAARGLGSWLLVPIGMGEEYLGTIGLGRRVGGPRWIDSEINAAAVVAADVAEVVVDARMMARERELNAELRTVIDYRRDMVNTLAHELRNPVSVLFTHLELLGQEPDASPVAPSLGAMRRAAQRIEAMVDDLMTLASISEADQSVPSADVDLSALVADSVDFIRPMATSADVDLRTGIEQGVVVAGDEVALQRLVNNLLSNAVKYTPDGGEVSLALVREAVDGRDGVRLTCQDSGMGIAESELERVFTPFFRSANPAARRRPGTGLGLAIVEQVVTWHQGTVEVSSVLGTGTTFTVWLPLTEPVEAG